MKVKKTTALVAFLMATGSLAYAQTQPVEKVAPTMQNQPQLIEKVEANPKNNNIPYEKWRLPNGLTVILHEDHSDPIVHVEVTYNVGSNREAPGRSGFAHLFEHMLFQGSEHVKDEEHFKIVSEAGGEMNGSTTQDRTNYFETLPANQLETALWLESDRMGFLLDSLTAKKFEVQRSTVKNEKGQNVENRPYGMVEEYKNKSLYPMGHPYSWPVIGYTDDLDRASLDDVRAFFMRWYGPNNATIVIAGDIKTSEALKLTEKYFNSMNRCPDVKKLRVEQPILATDQYAQYTDNVYFPLSTFTFPTVPQYSKDEPALDILASIMGDGNNSIFYKNFVKADKAIQAGVGHGSLELAGEFTIQVLAYPDEQTGKANFNDIEKRIRETIDQFDRDGFTDDQLQSAKAKIQSSFLNYAGGLQGRAALLTIWNLRANKSGFNLSDEEDRYSKITREDVIRVFNKYIKGKKAAVVNVYPKNPFDTDSVKVKSNNPYAGVMPPKDPQYQNLLYKKPVDNIDRSKRPKAGASVTPVVPEYYSSSFKNGLKVIGTKNSEIPKVYIQIEIEGGDLMLEKPDRGGLAALTAGMMDEGTQKYTTEQISAELEKLGATITFNASKQSTIISFDCLAKNIDPALKLLEEKLLHPRFDEEDFFRVRKQLKESISSSKRDDANTMAQEAFSNQLYGNTILGMPVTAKNIGKLKLQDVKEYYSKYYSPNVANVVVVGDISEQEIMPKLQFLNNWESKNVVLPTSISSNKPEKSQVFFVNKARAPQSVVYLGQPALPYDATGDYFKCQIMNFILGGAFNSHINLNLREDKGWTYGARSGFRGAKQFGQFVASASVRRSATDSTITEVMKELNNYVNKGITDDELAFTKSSLLSNDALKYETDYDKLGFLSNIVKNNLSKDYIAKQQEILKGITKKEINALAKKYIDPSKMIIVVVGDDEKVKKPIDQVGFGKSKTVYVDN